MDPLLSFKAFLKVAETGSFSEAARRMGVATSVVKKRVDQLESGAKAALFHRSTRRMALTDAGRRQVPVLQRAVQEMEQALAGVQRHPAELEGRLRIKAPTTMTAMYIGDMLNRFLRANPGVAIELVVMDRPVNPLHEALDLAIGMSPGSYEGVAEVGLCELQRLVVATPDYLARRGRPRKPHDLQSHAILNFEPTGSTWNFDGPTGPIVVGLEPRLASNDGQYLLRAALEGAGIARLSTYVVARFVQTGQLEVLLPDFAAPAYWLRLMFPEARQACEPLRSIIRFLTAEFRPAPPWESGRLNDELLDR